MLDSGLNKEKIKNVQMNKNDGFRIREEQYILRTTKFYPEACVDNNWHILSYKNQCFNLNGKDYCDSYEDAVYVIERFKISQDNTIIKEIIHEYNDSI